MNELRILYLYDNFAQCIRKGKLENDLDIQDKVPFQHVPGGTAENHECFRIGGLQVEFRTRKQLPNANRFKLFDS
jgi:hypothetical protein